MSEADRLMGRYCPDESEPVNELTPRQWHASIVSQALRTEAVGLRQGCIDTPHLRPALESIIEKNEQAADAIDGMLAEAQERGWGKA